MTSGSIIEYLGRGVDLFDLDPWTPRTKARILTALPNTETVPIGSTGMVRTYADSFLEITHDILIEAGLKGSYGNFSASINSKFSRSEKDTEKLHYMKITSTVTGDTIMVAGGVDTLKANMSDAFRAALASASVDDLFKQYGTHVASKIRVGGKAEYFCRSSDTSSMTRQEFEVAATAHYQSLGGEVEGSTKVNRTDSRSEQKIVGAQSLLTIGGSPDVATKISGEGGWSEWAATCKDSPGFLGYDDDGLVPIWELADNAGRSAAIREAYRRKAAKQLRPTILSATSEVASHPDVRVTVPDGYKLLSGGALDRWSGEGNLLTASFPESDNTWRASGKDHLASSPASLSVFAIAIYDPDDLWEVKQFSTKSGSASWPSAQVSVAEGYVMVGGGAQVQYSGEGNLLFASYPANGTTWAVQSKDHGRGDAATISAFAVGLKSKVDGVHVEAGLVSSSSNAAAQPTAAASPSAGYVMVGGGAKTRFDGEGILLTASYPVDSQTWEAKSKDHLKGDNGYADVYCIGLKVTST